MLIGPLLVTLAISFSGLNQVDRKTVTLKELIGADWYAVVSAPQQAIAQRVDGVAPTVAIAIGKPITPSKAWVKVFVQTLLDRKTIEPYVTPKCGFNPNVRISLTRDQVNLDIEFCFGCNMMRIMNREGTPETAMLYFGPGRKTYLSQMQRLFPNDKWLAKLKP